MGRPKMMTNKFEGHRFSNYLGSAGEYRVASELLLRGFNPAIRAVDTGIDIVLENGLTIQVKTTSGPTSNEKDRPSRYQFGLSNTTYKKGKMIKTVSKLKADYFVVWLVDIDRFYVIPRSELEGRVTIQLNPLCLGKKTSTYSKYLDAWDLLNI